MEENETLTEVKSKLKSALSELETKNTKIEHLMEQVSKNQNLATELEKVEIKFNQLTSQFSDLKQNKTKIQKEKHALSKQVKRWQDKSEKLKLELEEKAKLLHTLESENAQIETDIPSSKSTFQIHIYLQDDGYHGKIFFPITKEQRAFKGIDANAILNFINDHLPVLSDQQVDSKLVSNETKMHKAPGKPDKTLDKPDKSKGDVLSKEKNLKESVTKSKEFNFPTNVFDHLKPFDFMFEIDFSDMPLVMDNNIVYKALLYAKPLNGGNRFCIGAVENIDPTKVVSAEIIPNVLTKGDYRLEVLLTSQRNGDQPSPVTAFHEGSLIHVY